VAVTLLYAAGVGYKLFMIFKAGGAEAAR
jgi:hypothetical protein